MVPFEVFRRCARWRCPRCGIGRLFEAPAAGDAALQRRGLARLPWFRMPPRCRFCLLPFQREAGYFLGAIYINYGLTAAVVVCGVFLVPLWWPLPTWVEITVWSAFAVLFPLLFFRHARAFWLAIDYLVDPWEPAPRSKP